MIIQLVVFNNQLMGLTDSGKLKLWNPNILDWVDFENA